MKGACSRVVVKAVIFLNVMNIVPAALGPGVYSSSKRNEYQK
jgi:hypothetical protein